MIKEVLTLAFASFLLSSGCADNDSRKYIAVAERKLAESNIDVGERKPVVSYQDDRVTVTFPAPQNELSGDWTILISAETMDIIEVRIYR